MFIKKFFSVLLLLTVLILPQTVFAEKTDWFDRSFDFRDIRRVIVFNLTANRGLDYGGDIVWRNMQDIFAQSMSKMRCQIVTEAQARREIGYRIGMDLDSLSFSNPMEARRIVMENAYTIADAWVLSNLDIWGISSYVIPEHTEWQSKRETRTYRDRHGRHREEVYYVQVPVTYPPRRVDVLTVQMTFQVFEARRGEMIFARKDAREREDYSSMGMYNRICDSFFEDFGKRMR